MKKLLILFVLFSARAYGADVNAVTCNAPDIQGAINVAHSGDRVVIPAGDCTWTYSVQIVDKVITLWANGSCVNCGTKDATFSGSTNITCQTQHCIVLKNGIGTAGPEVMGLHLKCTTTSETMVYNEAWRFNVHDNFFECDRLMGTTNFGQLTYNYYASGVYARNLSVNVRHLLKGVSDGSRNEWAAPSTIGNPNQDYVVYMEGSTFRFTVFGNVVDHENGARGVFRRNYVQNVYLEVHGIHIGGDIPLWPNGRSWEVYDNVFFCEAAYRGTGGCYAAIRPRGGTGVVFNNTVDGYDIGVALDNQRSDTDFGGLYGSCNGHQSIDGNQIGGWPCDGQIGRGQMTGSGIQPQASEPAYFWNNRFNGVIATPGILGGGSIRDIQNNRDYFTSPRPNYVPYPYPYAPSSTVPVPIPPDPTPVPPTPTPIPPTPAPVGPSITLKTPTAGQVIAVKTFSITTEATDDVGVAWSELFINGQLVKSGAFTTMSYSWNTSPYKGRSVTIKATAKDADGLTAEAKATVTVNK
jgi:hypothetical protein